MAELASISRLELFKKLYELEYGESIERDKSTSFENSEIYETYKKRFKKRITEYYKIPVKKTKIKIPYEYIDVFLSMLYEASKNNNKKFHDKNYDAYIERTDGAIKSYIKYNFDENEVEEIYKNIELPSKKKKRLTKL